MFCSRKERLGQIHFFVGDPQWEKDAAGNSFYNKRPKCFSVSVKTQDSRNSLKKITQKLIKHWNQKSKYPAQMVKLQNADVVWIKDEKFAQIVSDDYDSFLKIENKITNMLQKLNI